MERKGTNALALVAGGIGAVVVARALLKRRSNFNFRDKVVIVTGSSRGLGLVLARELVQEGARVGLCARNRAELDRAESDLGRPDQVLTHACDLSRREEVERMVAVVRERWGRVDVVINNAGIIVVGPIEEMTLEDFQEAMAINFWAAVHTTLAVLPEMRRRRAGRIVNISSIGGEVSVPHLLPYCASKFALTGFSEGLRSEVAKDGIVVTTVCPGLMRTGSPPNAFFKGQHRAEYAWFALGDALPGLSTSAESAARQILRACRRGDAEVTLTLPAKIAARVHGLFPGLTTDVMSAVNRLLPDAGGIGTQRVRGFESESPVAPSWLTTLSDRASVRNNELLR